MRFKASETEEEHVMVQRDIRDLLYILAYQNRDGNDVTAYLMLEDFEERRLA